MLAQGPLRGALQFSPAPPRGLGLQRPSQSRSPNPSKSFSLRVRLEETGEIYRLSSCHGDTTVRELKEELDLMAGIPFHFQCILYLDQGGASRATCSGPDPSGRPPGISPASIPNWPPLLRTSTPKPTPPDRNQDLQPPISMTPTSHHHSS